MTINVNSGSKKLLYGRPVEAMLSNFYTAPIQLIDAGETVRFDSVEIPIQMMKFPYGDGRRVTILLLPPIEAKALGEEADCESVWWDGEQITYGSDEHHALIEEFIWAKFEQHPELATALLSTGEEKIIHEVGTEFERTSLPKQLFCEILTRIRLEYGNKRRDKHEDTQSI